MEKMGAPPHWMGHVQVEDVDKTAARAKELGGKVYVEPRDIEKVGRFSVIADPQGAVISVFKPSSDMQAHEIKAGEFCWTELYTTDLESAWLFYSDILGWKKMNDMDMGPMGTYRIFGVGEKQLGGMMKKPEMMKAPPSWAYYIEVADLEPAMERAKKKGANIINGPMDVPGGRIVQMMDPGGAFTALHQAKKE
jgi:predicted enzyme related to lactoylglutathione lyase